MNLKLVECLNNIVNRFLKVLFRVSVEVVFGIWVEISYYYSYALFLERKL